jgi:nitrogen regulatory protein P-II 1
MKELVMIIRPEKLEVLKQILNKNGIYGMTVSTVMGCGTQKGLPEDSTAIKGTDIVINLLPKVRVESVVADDAAEVVIEQVRDKLCTGSVGDGKIFVRPIDEAIRIRTGERGVKAL